MSLDFVKEARAAQRRARVRERQRAQVSQPMLLQAPIKIDIGLSREPGMADAYLSGAEPEHGAVWLAEVVDTCEPQARRRWRFPADKLDRLLWPLPPVDVALDAGAQAVARALWAHKLGLRPLQVVRNGRRLTGKSIRGDWPAELRVRDVPWNAVLALMDLKVPVTVTRDAAKLMNVRLSGRNIGTASWAGSYVRIESSQADMMAEIAEHLPGLSYDGPVGSGRYRLPALNATRLFSVPAIRVPDTVKDHIYEVQDKVEPVQPPGPFPFELHGFQIRDIARAREIARVGGGVLLAGDMGSGKTACAAALLAIEDWWPAVIVCPLAALTAWQRQLADMERTFHLATGSLAEDRLALARGGFDAFLVSYDRLHNFTDLLDGSTTELDTPDGPVAADNFHPQAIVADELQYIRSPGSRRSKALRALAGHIPHRIGLTGTPIMNRLTDLLAQGAFLLPGEWNARGGKKDLSDIYVADDSIKAAADHLGAFMVRRKMSDTGVTLPDANDWRVDVEITSAQRQAIADLEEAARKAKDAGDVKDKIHAFTLLHKQRRIVACPSAEGLPGGNPKADAMLELVERGVGEGKKSVVFFNYRDTFGDYTRALDAAGIGWVAITGAHSPAERAESERRFHEDDSVWVILGSYGAMNAAVTLSPTGKLWIAEPHPDLGITSQARARVRRLNQTDPIDLISLVAPDTFDERIMELLADKRELFAMVVDGEAGADISALDTSLDDLLYVLTGDGRDD